MVAQVLRASPMSDRRRQLLSRYDQQVSRRPASRRRGMEEYAVVITGNGPGARTKPDTPMEVGTFNYYTLRREPVLDSHGREIQGIVLSCHKTYVADSEDGASWAPYLGYEQGCAEAYDLRIQPQPKGRGKVLSLWKENTFETFLEADALMEEAAESGRAAGQLKLPTFWAGFMAGSLQPAADTAATRKLVVEYFRAAGTGGVMNVPPAYKSPGGVIHAIDRDGDGVYISFGDNHTEVVVLAASAVLFPYVKEGAEIGKEGPLGTPAPARDYRTYEEFIATVGAPSADRIRDDIVRMADEFHQGLMCRKVQLCSAAQLPEAKACLEDIRDVPRMQVVSRNAIEGDGYDLISLPESWAAQFQFA